jgi:hypothetical protein
LGFDLSRGGGDIEKTIVGIIEKIHFKFCIMGSEEVRFEGHFAKRRQNQSELKGSEHESEKGKGKGKGRESL